jgi:hypothetical protein
LSPSAVTSKRSWNPKRGRTPTFTTSHTTWSRQGAELKESINLWNFYTMSRARTPLRKASRRNSLLLCTDHLWSPVIWHIHNQGLRPARSNNLFPLSSSGARKTHSHGW